MIDIAKIKYDVVAVLQDGRQLNISDVVSALGWSEGEKELSAKITLKVANSTFEGKQMAELIRPFTPIFIYATMDGDKSEEVIRGTVTNWELVETSREFYLQLGTSDEAQALRKNQDEFFFRMIAAPKKFSKKYLLNGKLPTKSKFKT